MAQEKTAEIEARLWLNYGTEYNARLFHKIASRYDSLVEAKSAFENGVEWGAALPEHVRARLREAEKPGFVQRFYEQMEKKNIRFTYLGNERYPKLLAEIPDPPSVLYYIGTIDPDPELSIAMVGSRHPSKYGVEVAKRFGYELASAGALVVSGLAEGIDACAARGALDAVRALAVPIDRVLMVGGGARSTAVQALAPERLGVEVLLPEPGEYVALGAALHLAASWLRRGLRRVFADGA